MADLFNKRFIINTGKGGVGKTTISVAMALAFARRGKRVLLMQMNVPDKVGAVFGKPPVGADIVELTDNLFAVNPTPQDALREYALMILKLKLIYNAVFENQLVSRFLKMMPGLPELVMLGKAYFHEQEKTGKRGGRPVWDAVIIDAPATGHGLFLLQIPRVIDDALTSGMMVEEAQRMVALLRDRERSTLNIVTLAEDMPVNETIELHGRVEKEIGMHVGYVVANAIFPRLFNGPEARHLEQLLDSWGDDRDELGAVLAAGVFRARRRDLQEQHLERLKYDPGVPMVEVPFIFEAELNRKCLERIADHFTEAIERQRMTR